MDRQLLAKLSFLEGYASDLPATSANNFMRSGTINMMVTGAGLVRPFNGLTLDASPTPPKGSRVNFLTDDSYAGLGNSATPGIGSVFETIDLLFFIGSGQLRVRGADVTIDASLVTATSQLQYLTRNAGLFNNGSSLFQVGHARPSKASIFARTPVGPGHKVMNAAVTTCVWRVDSNTGQTSLPSPASDILQVSNGSVIQTFPNADANAQDRWGIGVTIPGLADLGNLYQLPIDLGGEVLESTLAYTRIVVADATITDETLTLDPGTAVGDRFTSADIGRRVLSNTAGVDSWIVSITDPFNAELKDPATANLVSDPMTISHAVDGILRAIEISWADTDLFGQNLAPFQAFEPPDGNFAGGLMDTFYIEDMAGTIYYSIPNEFSFPVSRRLFTEDKAVSYISTGHGFHWRLAPQSISQLYYSGGQKPLQLNVKTKNLGCKFPQNACLGYNGRLMIWTGRPTIIDNDGSIDSTFHTLVAAEFAGWEDQTSAEPVVAAYDPIGQYELWCKGSKVMARHAPTGRWCSPIITTTWSATGTILGSVIVGEKLRLVIKESSNLNHYHWDVGNGSPVTLYSYHRKTPEEQTTIVLVKSILHAGSTTTKLKYYVVKNFEHEIQLHPATGIDIATTPVHQIARKFRCDIRGVETFALKITAEGLAGAYAKGDFRFDEIEIHGVWHQTINANPGGH